MASTVKTYFRKVEAEDGPLTEIVLLICLMCKNMNEIKIDN